MEIILPLLNSLRAAILQFSDAKTAKTVDLEVVRCQIKRSAQHLPLTQVELPQFWVFGVVVVCDN